jgi:hypothetical protein
MWHYMCCPSHRQLLLALWWLHLTNAPSQPCSSSGGVYITWEFTSLSAAAAPAAAAAAAAAVQDGLPGALPAYRGTVDAVRTIVAREGWLGLYAGLTPSMLGSSEAGGKGGNSTGRHLLLHCAQHLAAVRQQGTAAIPAWLWLHCAVVRWQQARSPAHPLRHRCV